MPRVDAICVYPGVIKVWPGAYGAGGNDVETGKKEPPVDAISELVGVGTQYAFSERCPESWVL
jgi:hypothetical protein